MATFLDDSGKAPIEKLFENYQALRIIAFAATNNSKQLIEEALKYEKK